MATPTAEVIEQAEAVRQSGAANMMDRNGVQVAANDQGFYALVLWIEDNKRTYMSELLMELGK